METCTYSALSRCQKLCSICEGFQFHLHCIPQLESTCTRVVSYTLIAEVVLITSYEVVYLQSVYVFLRRLLEYIQSLF
jgi:hypothetical protein